MMISFGFRSRFSPPTVVNPCSLSLIPSRLALIPFIVGHCSSPRLKVKALATSATRAWKRNSSSATLGATMKALSGAELGGLKKASSEAVISPASNPERPSFHAPLGEHWLRREHRARCQRQALLAVDTERRNKCGDATGRHAQSPRHRSPRRGIMCFACFGRGEITAGTCNQRRALRGSEESARNARHLSPTTPKCRLPARARRLRDACSSRSMASWQQRAARGDDGPEGYALGDVTRIGVQTMKDIFKGTADGTREITGGIKQRWQEEQYGITGPLPDSGAGPSSAGAGPSGTTLLVAGAPPAAAPSSAPSSRKAPVSLLGDVHAMRGRTPDAPSWECVPQLATLASCGPAAASPGSSGWAAQPLRALRQAAVWPCGRAAVPESTPRPLTPQARRVLGRHGRARLRRQGCGRGVGRR